MLPPETTHTIFPAPPLPASAAATGVAPAPSATTRFRSTMSFSAAAVAASETTAGAVEKARGERPHLLQHSPRADAVHEARHVVDLSRPARRERRGERRGGCDLAGQYPDAGRDRADRRRDAAREASSSIGNHDRGDVGQILQDLETDGAVSRDDGGVAHGVDEDSLDAGMVVLDDHLPPIVER
jgi:hypothetical protein